MAKRLLLGVVSIFLVAGSAWATSLSILEPADKTQPIQFSYSGFLPGATSTVGTESVSFTGMIDSGFFASGYTFDVWLLESGGITDLGAGFISANVSDTIRVQFGLVLNNVLTPGACPPNVQSCQTITVSFQSYDPSTTLTTIIPGFGPYRFSSLQETGGVQDLSGYVDELPLSVQSRPVPEPSTLALFWVGLTGLVGCFKRKLG